MSRHERVLLEGPAGTIEVFVEAPEAPAAVALLDLASRVAAQVSIQNTRVLRVVQSD